MAKASAAKRKARQAQRQRQQKRRRLIWYGVGLALLITLLGLGVQGFQASRARQAIGQAVSFQGSQHINPGSSRAPYISDPPTSGPHAGAVGAGFYDTPIPDENIVHNLEHGHVAISYDCAQLADCETVKDNLRRLVRRYDTRKIIAVPRQNRDAPIALTAWQRLDLLEQYDEARISAFIEAWRNRGPE